MEMTLQAQKRDENVATKVLRKEGWVPGCVFGKDQKATSIQIPLIKLRACLAKHPTKLELDVKGAGKFLVGVEEVQRGPLGDGLVHISFHALNKNEKANLTVPLEFVGKAAGSMDGGIVKEVLHEVTIKGYPKDLPDKVQVDVSTLELGSSIHINDISKNYSFEFAPDDLEKVLVTCSYPKVAKVESTAESTDMTPVEGTITEETVGETSDEKKSAA